MRPTSSVFESITAFVPAPEKEWRKKWSNFGGNPLRTKTYRLNSNLYGKSDKTISWRHRQTIGLIFGEKQSPVDLIEDLLLRSGFNSPEELRTIVELPIGFLACRTAEDEAGDFVNTATAQPAEILRQALLLGLCGPDFFNPKRSVIWTRSRLVRRVELFETGDFYADN
jgi:hypothetical protein